MLKKEAGKQTGKKAGKKAGKRREKPGKTGKREKAYREKRDTTLWSIPFSRFDSLKDLEHNRRLNKRFKFLAKRLSRFS